MVRLEEWNLRLVRVGRSLRAVGLQGKAGHVGAPRRKVEARVGRVRLGHGRASHGEGEYGEGTETHFEFKSGEPRQRWNGLVVDSSEQVVQVGSSPSPTQEKGESISVTYRKTEGSVMVVSIHGCFTFPPTTRSRPSGQDRSACRSSPITYTTQANAWALAGCWMPLPVDLAWRGAISGWNCLLPASLWKWPTSTLP